MTYSDKLLAPMAALPVALSALGELDQFVTWYAWPRAGHDGKLDKIPCHWATGAPCDAHNSANWTTATAALAKAPLYDRGHGSGAGFVFTRDDPFFFLDIDGALDDAGQWSPVAVELCARFGGAAVEVSLSGRGLHIFGRAAAIPHGTRNTAHRLELYTSRRFVALTGCHARGDAGLDCSAPLAATVAQYFPPTAGPTNARGEWTTEPVAEWSGPADDDKLIDTALNSSSRNPDMVFGDAVSFADLWNANADKLALRWPHDRAPYGQSEADQALANRLAFWTGKDCERMDRLMRRSALARDKYDDRRPEGTYLKRTILNACTFVTSVAGTVARQEHQAFGANAGNPLGAAASETAAWPEVDLTLLQGPEIPAPQFPAGILGPYWADWCAVAARGANAPLDYAAASLLAVAATLIGNARVLAASLDWHEPPILWCVLVGVPSAGKSPALDPLIKIVERIEHRMGVEFEDTFRRYQGDLVVAKEHKERWAKDVKNALTASAAPPDLPQCADEPQPPPRPRVMISDATVEAAAEVSAGNPKGLLLYRDELAGWWRGFNRYGGDGERQFWLQAFGARPYTVDRKKAGKPVIIPRLAIAVLGGAQPDVLNSMIGGEADGFAARFLYAFPDPSPGFKLQTVAVDHERASAALARLHELSSVDDGSGVSRPWICNFSPGAAGIFEKWWDERRDQATSSTGLWGSWLGKQGGQVLRLALVIEHLWWCAPTNSADSAKTSPATVSVDALKAAIALVDEWAGPMARRAFGWAGASPEEADASALAKWLVQARVPEFNAREARRSAGGPGGRLSDSKQMNEACAALVNAGILRKVTVRSDGKPGRPPETYAVNPNLLALSTLSSGARNAE